MIPLSTTELKIYSAMLDDPGHVWTTDQIAELIYEDRERPKNWRSATTVRINAIRMKTVQRGSDHVIKVSKSRGRGQVGKYALKKTALKLGLKGI